ncbi:unnamed protein product [Calypogeia fissa]
MATSPAAKRSSRRCRKEPRPEASSQCSRQGITESTTFLGPTATSETSPKAQGEVDRLAGGTTASTPSSD